MNSRVQLALNVTDLDRAISFYETLLGVKPHKVKDGYANFAVSNPPLKLVLLEGPEGGTLNHLGVEVFDADEVAGAATRFADAGLEADVRTTELCCHAVQDKVWTHDPDGAPWEVYTILDDAPSAVTEANRCCS